MPFNEQTIIDSVAAYERGIVGIRNSYGFSQNPDTLAGVSLPCVVHYVASTTAAPRANYGVWANTINLKSIVFVTPRQAQGGKLKFIEGTAIPYSQLWRSMFQDPTVIQSLLSSTASIKAFWLGGNYGAGAPYLSYSSIDYLGWVMNHLYVSA